VQDRYQLRRYLAGATAARTGDEMSGPALLLVGLSATGSPAVGSALLAGLTISSGVAGPMLGAVLDRSPAPGRLLAGALVSYAGGLLLVATLVGDLATVLVVALAALVGCGAPALTGAWTAQLPRIVSPAGVQRGFSLDAATYAAASLAGPALAGLVATALGARWAVVAAVALLAAAVPVALLLPREAGADGADERPRPEAAGAGERPRAEAAGAGERPPDRGPLRAELARGIGAIVARPPLLAVTLATMLSAAGFAGFVVASPLLGERLAGSAAAGTALLSVLAVGSLIGATALARRPWRGRPEHLLVATTVALGVAFALLAVADSFPLAVGLSFAAGLAEGPQLAAVFGVRHRESPESLRAQLFTTAASVKMSAYAVGAAATGALAVHSTTACLIAAAAAQGLAVIAIVALTARARRPPAARTARA
jgi:predicted MFS family arabinose efflux permease